MSPAAFMENEKKVLTAAYISAGYDPATHISDEACLNGQSTTDAPFHFPLKTTDIFVPKVAQVGSGSKRSARLPSPLKGKLHCFNKHCLLQGVPTQLQPKDLTYLSF